MVEGECYPPLRLNVCPRCGYSLAAHPTRGQCPECGRAYNDEEEIVLYGYGMGGRATQWNSRPASILGIIFGSLFALLYLWMSIGRSPWGTAMWMAIFASGLGAHLWRRFAAAGDAPLVQVKLSPQGFRQGTRGTGPLPFERNDVAALESWTRETNVRVNFIGPGRVQVIVTTRGKSWWNRAREPVNADVAVEQGQLEAIRRRLAIWTNMEGRGRIGQAMPN